MVLLLQECVLFVERLLFSQLMLELMHLLEQVTDPVEQRLLLFHHGVEFDLQVFAFFRQHAVVRALIGQLIDGRVELLFELAVELLQLIVIVDELLVRLLKVLRGVGGENALVLDLLVQMALFTVFGLKVLDAQRGLLKIVLQPEFIGLKVLDVMIESFDRFLERTLNRRVNFVRLENMILERREHRIRIMQLRFCSLTKRCWICATSSFFLNGRRT